MIRSLLQRGDTRLTKIVRVNDVLVLVDVDVKLLQIGRQASGRSIEALHSISIRDVVVPVDNGSHGWRIKFGGSDSKRTDLFDCPCASAKTRKESEDGWLWQ